jgi:hypothetical protein
MTVKMQKAGAKPVEVGDDAVEAFEAAGFSLCDGEVATEAVDSGTSELSPEEKQTEVDAAGKMARDDAEAKGMEAGEVEEAGAAAEAESAASLDDE